MDIESFVQLFSSLGFPVVMVVYFIWHSNQMETNHREEIANMNESLNNNTLVIQKLLDKLDKED